MPHALRLTASGTFLHGDHRAPPAVFGRDGISHGCIGPRDAEEGGADTPAGWFFGRGPAGDVIEVVGGKDRTVAPENGLGGRNMNRRAWKAGCAVK